VIPVIIATGPLPQAPNLNWSQVAVIIQPEDIPKIGKLILEDFNNMSEAQYQSRMLLCRQAFETLTPGEFYTSVIKKAVTARGSQPSARGRDLEPAQASGV
jgi:hypothetical protein